MSVENSDLFISLSILQGTHDAQGTAFFIATAASVTSAPGKSHITIWSAMPSLSTDVQDDRQTLASHKVALACAICIVSLCALMVYPIDYLAFIDSLVMIGVISRTQIKTVEQYLRHSSICFTLPFAYVRLVYVSFLLYVSELNPRLFQEIFVNCLE